MNNSVKKLDRSYYIFKEIVYLEKQIEKNEKAILRILSLEQS